MATTSILKSWEVGPSTELKTLLFITPNTADAGDTLEITLTDYGISATGLLNVESWKHTTDGSVIVAEANTCIVASGVLTVTIVAGTNNDMRLIKITGRSTVGAFS